MGKPVIACSTTRGFSRTGVLRAWLNDAYSLAITGAGGIPFPFSPCLPDRVVDEILSRCDGVMLTGGGDLHSSLWGEPLHEEAVDLDAERDAQEARVARRVLRRGIPLLGICRGMQIANVAFGGTLHQHLPDVPGVRINHKQSERRKRKVHGIKTQRGSVIARLFASYDRRVNTSHHQAVNAPGRGLVPTAWSSDGVIEALELNPSKTFFLLVQWHPEELTRFPEHARLFYALVRAAGKRGRSAR
jgi:putative glutamine amidotransferase